MKWKLFTAPAASLVVFLIIFATGCSGVKPETKTPTERGRITEEDVTETPAPARGSDETPRDQQSQTFTGPPAPPAAESSSSGEPGQPQRRRYYWNPGSSGKSWEADKPAEREQR
jgi:hypothetical protein